MAWVLGSSPRMTKVGYTNAAASLHANAAANLHTNTAAGLSPPT